MSQRVINHHVDDASRLRFRTTLKCQPRWCVLEEVLNGNDGSLRHTNRLNARFHTVFHDDGSSRLAVRLAGNLQFGDHADARQRLASEAQRNDGSQILLCSKF